MNHFWYVVTHPFEGHHVGKVLETVDPSRLATNHVVAIPAGAKGSSPVAAKDTETPATEAGAK